MKINFTINGTALQTQTVDGVTYWYLEGKKALIREPVLYFAEGIYNDAYGEYVGRGWHVSHEASRMQILAKNHFRIYAQSQPVLPNILTISE